MPDQIAARINSFYKSCIVYAINYIINALLKNFTIFTKKYIIVWQRYLSSVESVKFLRRER